MRRGARRGVWGGGRGALCSRARHSRPPPSVPTPHTDARRPQPGTALGVPACHARQGGGGGAGAARRVSGAGRRGRAPARDCNRDGRDPARDRRERGAWGGGSGEREVTARGSFSPQNHSPAAEAARSAAASATRPA